MNAQATSKAQMRTVLTYHSIVRDASPYIYSASYAQFDSHLQWIVGLREDSQRRAFEPEITFDDGGSSDYELALPLLNERSCKGKFFVTAGLIGNREGFMSWDQVRALAREGHSVQSHGWSHLLLTRANPAELASELERSKKEIEDQLSSSIPELSLPGGRWNKAVLEACAKAGYTRVYHSNPWVDPEEKHGVEFVGRLMVRNSMNLDQIRAIVMQEPATVFRYRMQHRIKEGAKKLIGDQTYHWLWQQMARMTRKGGPTYQGEAMTEDRSR